MEEVGCNPSFLTFARYEFFQADMRRCKDFVVRTGMIIFNHKNTIRSDYDPNTYV